MTTTLTAQAISVRARTRTLVDDLRLSFAAGECVAIVGPNGAGKTTMLRALSGAQKLAAGAVKLKGRDIGAYSQRALAGHRAVLSQSVSVTFPFTVADVVRMGAGDYANPSTETWVIDALAEVDLLPLHDRIITSLSGGEQQRVHFARVLVQLAWGEAINGPGVLLLDEPIASLDLRHQLDFLATVKRCAARGVTVIAILHDLNWAAAFADRIVVLDRGRIAADGPASTTITPDMLGRVFRVATGATSSMVPGSPVVLPQTMVPLAR